LGISGFCFDHRTTRQTDKRTTTKDEDDHDHDHDHEDEDEDDRTSTSMTGGATGPYA
jgi:hypothetical protein